MPWFQSRAGVVKRGLFSAVVTVIVVGAIELGMRFVLPLVAPSQHHAVLEYRHRWFPRWDPSPIFEPHPYVAYVHSDDAPGVNADGFTFPETTRHKPEGVFRVAALGGSTTDGPEAWPYHLERKLGRMSLSREVEVLNFGMSGWTTAESAVNFVLNVQDYQPDVVIVHHAANDLGPIDHPSFHPDYRHYRRVLQMDSDQQGKLRLRQRWTYRVDTFLCRYSLLYVWSRVRLLGEERSEYSLTHLTTWSEGPNEDVDAATRTAPFVRNLETIGRLAELNGSRVLFAAIPWIRPELAPELAHQWGPGLGAGMAEQNQRLLTVALDNGWAALDLDAVMSDRRELYVDPIHMTQRGEVEKADRIASHMLSIGWLPAGEDDTDPAIEEPEP